MKKRTVDLLFGIIGPTSRASVVAKNVCAMLVMVVAVVVPDVHKLHNIDFRANHISDVRGTFSKV